MNGIHDAFCGAIGYEVPLHGCTERYWFEALKMGMTPDDVRLVVKGRLQRIRDGVRHPESLYIRNVVGSEEAISNALEEAAAIRAKMRIKTFSPGKAEVLRATGRSDEPEQARMIPIKEVIEGLRSAVG